MKKCLRCGSNNISSSFELRIEGNPHVVTLAETGKIFSKRVGKPELFKI